MPSLPRWTLCCAAALLLAAPARTAAQRPPALPMGREVRGELSPSDPAFTQGGRFRAYRFQARPDHVYQFTASAPLASPRLVVGRPLGAVTDFIVSEGGGTDSVRLRFRPPAPGPYLVLVEADTTGAFTLRADEISSPPPPPRSLALGQVVEGALTEASLEMPGMQGMMVYADVYTFSGRAGQRVSALTDRGGDAITFGRVVNGRFVPLEPDSAALARGMVVPGDGEYAVRIQGALGQDGRAPYRLRVSDASARPAARRLQLGRPDSASLEPLDAFDADGMPSDEWIVSAPAGQILTVSVTSTEFDTFVRVGRERDGTFELLASDDDGGDGVNALAVTPPLPDSGDYLVRVSGFMGSMDLRGPYTVLVQEQRSAASAAPRPRRPRPERRPVRWGAPLPGVLDETDALAMDGTPVDEWTFSARAGQRVTITAASDAFDAYLSVGYVDEGAFQELSSNDDSPAGEGSARIVMVAPETREYVVRVNTLPDQAGAYTVTVDRGR